MWIRSGSTCGEKDLTQRVRETPPGASGISTCQIRMGMNCRLRVRSSSLSTNAWSRRSPKMGLWKDGAEYRVAERKLIRPEGGPMAYHEVRIEVWCDWNPAESDLDEIARSMRVGEAICTMREVVAVVNRPQDIEDEEAMSFFGGEEGDADESQG